ncbi:FecR domain-containing protein [bacterium SCSIO 12696]|nr:FecR domain-containing protein [bacterium SCSIO 12696]
MNKSSSLKAHAAVSEQAADWLIRMDGDKPLTKAELKELGEWLHRSPMHRSELESLYALWSDNVLTELMQPLHQGVSTDKAEFVERKGSITRSPWRWAAMASCILCVCVLAFLNFSTRQELGNGNGIYATSIGEQKTLSLLDGSTVLLNTNSELEVSYAETHRSVYLLRGEAYFEVAKNADRPFRVYAGSGRIQAIGTAFSVHVQESDVSVLVAEGSVAFAPVQQALTEGQVTQSNEQISQKDTYGKNRSIDVDSSQLEPVAESILNAGESGTIALLVKKHTDTAKVEKKSIPSSELFRKHSWRDGYLTFSGESLEDAMQEVSRYTTMSIEITDQKVAGIPIGGRFKFDEMEKMFDILEQGFGIDVHRVGENRVQLSSIKK